MMKSSNQMLSFLDQALSIIEDQFELRVALAKGEPQKAYSFHLSEESEVAFRLTPVPPKPEVKARS